MGENRFKKDQSGIHGGAVADGTLAPLQAAADAHFTHGFCPECVHKLYPELFDGKQDNPY